MYIFNPSPFFIAKLVYRSVAASLHLKMDAWNTLSFPFGARPVFTGFLLLSFRECMHLYINRPSVSMVFFDASIPMSFLTQKVFPLGDRKVATPRFWCSEWESVRFTRCTSLLEMVKIKHYIFSFKIYLKISFAKLFKNDTSNIKFLKITCREKTDLFSRKPLPCSKPLFLGT